MNAGDLAHLGHLVPVDLVPRRGVLTVRVGEQIVALVVRGALFVAGWLIRITCSEKQKKPGLKSRSK